MAEIELTHAWSEEEAERIMPKLETVFSHFPEFDGKLVTIGRTEARGTLGLYPAEASKNDRRYIRIRPDAAHHTIAHELIHVLTREKATDILALARSPELIDGPLAYLDVPEPIKENPAEHRDLLYETAVKAQERFGNHRQMIDWFEGRIAKACESR